MSLLNIFSVVFSHHIYLLSSVLVLSANFELYGSYGPTSIIISDSQRDNELALKLTVVQYFWQICQDSADRKYSVNLNFSSELSHHVRLIANLHWNWEYYIMLANLSWICRKETFSSVQCWKPTNRLLDLQQSIISRLSWQFRWCSNRVVANDKV